MTITTWILAAVGLVAFVIVVLAVNKLLLDAFDSRKARKRATSSTLNTVDEQRHTTAALGRIHGRSTRDDSDHSPTVEAHVLRPRTRGQIGGGHWL